MSDPTLQFDTAEYSEAAPTCVVCKQPPAGPHYQLGPNLVCPNCRTLLIQHYQPPRGVALAKGALFGVGAAVAGSVAWYAVSAATGVEWGILAIAIGWLVAYAIREGSGGGGLVQQILAVVLTYVAVVATYIPSMWEPGGEVLAIVGALGMPLFLILSREPSAILWFVIVGFALYGAWRRTAGVKLVFTGPFPGPEPGPR